MKFREENGLEVRVIKGSEPQELERGIEKLCEDYDLIDLQYSTTSTNFGFVEYSALALARKREVEVSREDQE